MSFKVVIIDDNISVRHSVKAYLSRLAKIYSLDLTIFTTDSGVEGLGFIFITSPDLIIVDTTLPKYSGRGILEYLSDNPRFKTDTVKVIALHEKGEKNLKLPSQFFSINKNNKNSFKEFRKVIDSTLKISTLKGSQTITDRFIAIVFHLGIIEEYAKNSQINKNLVQVMLVSIWGLFINILTKSLLALLVLASGKLEEENITQKNIDRQAFRRKYYPTLTLSVLAVTFLLANLSIFGLTQFGLLRQSTEKTEALVTMTVDAVSDAADMSPGDGFCDVTGSTGDGPCTLRAAIEEANTEDEAVEIEFNIDDYTRTVTNLSETLPMGEGTGTSNYGDTKYDQNGDLRSVWVESTGARGESDVYLYDSRNALSANNPLNLSDQLQVTEATGSVGSLLEIDIDLSGNSLVAWSETPGNRGYSDTYVYRSNLPIDNSNPLNLSDTLSGLFGEDSVSDIAIAHDSNNNVYVAWIEGTGMSGYTSVFLYNSGLPLSSSNPLNLSTHVSTYDSYQVELEINNLDEVFVLWSAHTNPSVVLGIDVYMYRSGSELVVDENPINLTENYIVRHLSGYSSSIIDSNFDSTGEIHIVWNDFSLFGGDTDMIYYDSGEVLSSTNPMRFWEYFGQSDSSPNSFPRLSISQDDTVFIAWNKDEVGATSPTGIYLYRSDQEVSLTNPINLSEFLQLGDGSLSVRNFSIESYDNNNVYVLWSESGGIKGGSDIYLYDSAKSLSSSNPQNLSNILGGIEGTGDVVFSNMNLIIDSDGQAVVSWIESPGSRGLGDVYLYRGSKEGRLNTQNPINLSELTASTEAEEDPRAQELSLDSSGNKILVSWHELNGLRGDSDRFLFEEIETFADGFVIQPLTQLPTITKGDISIVGQSQSGTDCSTQTHRIKIDGSVATGANGFLIDTGTLDTAVTISGLAINNFDDAGIDVLNSEAIIECNMIGLDFDGSTIQANNIGVQSLGGSNLIIGGDTLSERNIISGNTTYGINVVVDSTADIRGNLIGTDKTGLLSKPNDDGIMIRSESAGSNIGFDSGLDPDNGCSGACNLVSGNTGTGISIYDYDMEAVNNNVDLNILGNYVGVNIDGDSSLPNYDGMLVSYADGVTIGGTDFAERNIMSGNTRHGLVIWGTYDPDDPPTYEGGKIENLNVQKNFIGTDKLGTTAIENGFHGISMHQYMAAGVINDNIISGNSLDGIFSGFYPYYESEELTITNNKIGEDFNGNQMGNGRNGMFLAGSPRMIIGGNENDGNIIANNVNGGIELYNQAGDFDYPADLRAEISHNTISNNGTQGGIYIETDPGSDNTDILISSNIFTGNTPSNIDYQRGTGITVLGNSFVGASPLSGSINLFGNSAQNGVFSGNLFDDHIAIALDEERTQNDLNDVDIGANNLQNYPVLNSVEAYTDTKLYGTFNSESNTYFRIEAFSYGSDGDSLVEPHANAFIGSAIIQTDGSGNYDFSITPITIDGTIDGFENVTTTATKCNDSNCTQAVQTSELSDAVVAIQLTPTDTPEPTVTETPEPTPTNTPYPTSIGSAMWYSTLDNNSAIENPVIGTSPSTYSVTYEAGVIGNAAVVDSPEDGITVPIIANTDWNPSKGSIEFYFKPTVDQDASQALVLFSMRTDTNNKIRVVKENPSGAGALGYQYVQNGNNYRLVIDQANYSSVWNIGEWLHFKVNWDDSLDIDTDLQLFINGVELPHTRYGGEIDANSLSLPATLYICTDEIGNPDPQTGNCLGSIDDFKIFGEASIPEPTNTPAPTSTNTPVPTATLTPLPTPTKTPVPTPTTVPAQIATPIPTSQPSVTSVNETPTITPTNEISITPSVSPTIVVEISSTPTPTEKVTKSLLANILPKNTYTVPENSIVKSPVVKSIAKTINNTIQEFEAEAVTSFVETSVVIAEELKPITENINYLLSLQFIGREAAVLGTTTANILAFVSPVVVTAASQPKIMFHALTWFWKRRKSKSWGIVFDRINNTPIAFARIVLVQEGKTVASETSNLEGKYGFSLEKGIYDLYISHSDYLDFHKQIKISYNGQDLSEDIELSPKFQQDFTSQLSWIYYQIRKILSKNLFMINTMTFSIGLVYTLFMVTNSFTVLNYIILTLYLLQIVLVITFYFFREKNLGIVLDQDTNTPIRGAILRVFDNERQLDVVITDMNGRYNIYLEPGEYYLKITASGYIFPTESTTNIVVNKLGEKLFKFTIQDNQKLNLKFYLQRFSNLQLKEQVVLSPFS